MLRPRSPFFIRPRLSWDLFDWSWKFMRAANADHVDRSAPILRDLHLASRALYEQLSELPGADFGLTKLGLLMLCKTEHALDDEAALAARATCGRAVPPKGSTMIASGRESGRLWIAFKSCVL